jgi:hypothetical protein
MYAANVDACFQSPPLGDAEHILMLEQASGNNILDIKHWTIVHARQGAAVHTSHNREAANQKPFQWPATTNILLLHFVLTAKFSHITAHYFVRTDMHAQMPCMN